MITLSFLCQNSYFFSQNEEDGMFNNFKLGRYRKIKAGHIIQVYK